MRATGIVRRIDDLGRVVIPKEIRRTMRIREGDPLEIYTGSDGEVVLKKYSPIGELSEYAFQYAESIHKASGHAACITDKDQVIAVSGMSKKEYVDKSISRDVENLINEKKTATMSGSDVIIDIIRDDTGKSKFSSQMVVPIVSDGDSIGSIILLSTDPSVKMGETERKMALLAAGVLGSQLEG